MGVLSDIGGFLQSVSTPILDWVQGKKNREQSQENLERELAFNTSEAEKERDYNFRMWQLTNQYNSPTEQMARLKAAGLNPNMVYGSGNAAGLSSSKAPEYKRANTPSFSEVLPQPIMNPAGVLQAYQNFKYNAGKIVGQDLSNEIKEGTKGSKIALEGLKVALSKQGVKKAKQETIIKEIEAMLKGETFEYQVEGSKLATESAKEKVRAQKLENDLSELLKPYGLTSKDSALLRSIVRIFSKENPNISAVDIMMLLPLILPGVSGGVRALGTLKAAKAAKVASKAAKTVKIPLR